MDRKQFIETIFDVEDMVAWGDLDAHCSYPKSPWPEMLHTNHMKFCINPLQGKRCGDNVTHINSLLFEMDLDEKGAVIPRDTQIALFNSSGLPYSTMTWTGGKSIHVIVRLDAAVPKPLFKPLWHAIERCLTQKGCSIDPKTNLIPQISRLPNSTRDNGNRQDLIEVRARVTLKELGQWLKSNGETIEKPKPPRPQPIRYYSQDTYTDLQKWRYSLKSCVKFNGDYKSYAQTGNHMWLFEFGKALYKSDIDIDSALSISKQNWGDTYNTSADGPQPIEKAIRAGYKWKSNKL